nr:PREDICTED: uncharacterized protein LOC100883286 isoform X3 [Megachile rotundata]
MRSLELAWSRPYILPREARITRNIQAEAGADFLTVIRAKNVQLKRLILTDWIFSCKWGNRGKLLYALANFLGYLRLLGRFRALTVLRLDYPALSDQTLNALANAASKVLKILHISVRDSDSRQHTIADTAWHNLVLVCPELTVSYTIVNISHYEDMCYLLLPSVPLASFQMFSGHVWDQSRSRNFRSTVGLLITHYTNTLAEVMLQLRNNRELLDDLLVSMLVRCKHLTRLQYDGIIRSLDTLRDICQLQAESKTRFRTIHVKPRNVNARNRAVLHDINYNYDHKMAEQGVDFRIEDPASVLVFY